MTTSWFILLIALVLLPPSPAFAPDVWGILPVPEAGSISYITLGLVAMGVLRRRQRHKTVDLDANAD